MNHRPEHYSFQRYLAAKRTIDDRALNRHVWDTLHHTLTPNAAAQPLRILEIGGGIGTMVERLLEDGRFLSMSYHLLDEQAENIDAANQRLSNTFAAPRLNHKPTRPFQVSPTHALTLDASRGTPCDISLYTYDLYDFITQAGTLAEIDLVIAHAFLDLVDVPATLPKLTATLRPGALLYFTINFDGATILEPAIDPAFDALVEQVYHRTMDERVTNGKRSGDSHAGRHLFHQMQTANIHTLDAGSSDWVIIPHRGVYPHDEAYFLHFIINTMQGALAIHPDLDRDRFQDWVTRRHAQIERGELVYIAHQLDYLGVYQPAASGASIATSRPST